MDNHRRKMQAISSLRIAIAEAIGIQELTPSDREALLQHVRGFTDVIDRVVPDRPATAGTEKEFLG